MNIFATTFKLSRFVFLINKHARLLLQNGYTSKQQLFYCLLKKKQKKKEEKTQFT